jgi:hypothetical protein
VVGAVGDRPAEILLAAWASETHGHQTIQACGMRWTIALRELLAHPHRLQFLPQPALPEVPGAAAKEWLAEREAELLPVPYFHVVFSLPGQIADIAYQNKAVIYDLLFKASSETVLTIAADPKHLGARIGILSVLHTWGSALTHHPHVHMIVPGGGFSLDGNMASRR